MNIPSTVGVSIASGGFEWKSLFRYWKTVDLLFCLIVPSGYEKNVCSGRIGKEKTLSKSISFVAAR